MDNPYFDWSPISTRPILRWPGNARVAVAVVVSLGHLDWYPPAGTIIPPSIRPPRPTYPHILDLHNISQYEYGNRVGVFRITKVLEENGIRPTVAMDVAVMRRSQYLMDYLIARDAEFLGHGLSSERTITEEMTEEQERAFIAETSKAVEAATGQRPRGWIGSDYSESTRTVGLLAEDGYDYVLDWPTDEQPHQMKVPVGKMTNLPVMLELDDVFSHLGRAIPVQRFSQMITEQFDRLYHDGAVTGRVFVLNVHPWVMGQPYRIKYFSSAIAHISKHPDTWMATGSEIVDAYLQQV